MSDKTAKERRSKAKDARQLPAKDISPKRPKRKCKKPFVVEYRYLQHELDTKAAGLFFTHGWMRWNRYETQKQAEQVIETQGRKMAQCDWRLKD